MIRSCTVLSGKLVTGGCAGIERWLRFWLWTYHWTNLWEIALDVCFHSGMTAGPSDPYNRCNTAATSFRQDCLHTVRKKVEPKQCHLGGWSCFSLNNHVELFRTLFRQKQLHLWRWHQNSARGGAELRTMKWLQGWSRFGSTFFSVQVQGGSKHFNIEWEASSDAFCPLSIYNVWEKSHVLFKTKVTNMPSKPVGWYTQWLIC